MRGRGRIVLAVIGVVGALVVGLATYPLWRPLFVDDVVDEAFPEAPAAPPVATEAASPQAETMLTEAVEQPTQAQPTAVEVAPTEQPTPQGEAATDGMEGALALASGSFVEIDAVHGGMGTATIYQLADGSQIVRFENFEVTNGPDLHVFLSRSPEPRSAGDMSADDIDLGALKGNVGDQNYELPPGVDSSVYQSVLIYCVPFHVVFSTATLSGL